ncbi:hypothetical protein M0804_009972 [Polistes exclamans]|nr:hypothetical protein M0804_009972 [Polistes exclamans]
MSARKKGLRISKLEPFPSALLSALLGNLDEMPNRIRIWPSFETKEWKRKKKGKRFGFNWTLSKRSKNVCNDIPPSKIKLKQGYVSLTSKPQLTFVFASSYNGVETIDRT